MNQTKLKYLSLEFHINKLADAVFIMELSDDKVNTGIL